MTGFELGQLLATPDGLAEMGRANIEPALLLNKHLRNESNLCPEDRRLNREAIENGGRIFSVFKLKTGVKLYVITDATDGEGRRAATTIMVADEY